MKHSIGLYPRVRVQCDGRQVVSQAGSVLLVDTVRKTGLDQAIPQALAPWRNPRSLRTRVDASMGRMGPLPKKRPTGHSHASMPARSLRQGLSQLPLFCSARKYRQAVFGLLPSSNACNSCAVAVIRPTIRLR
ncbi:hypothetical protein SPURM210S_06489 [Streptomyces purpurascens]|nr:hypothetical protein GCM10010303_75600 [Streptomyces purpurascens]